MYHFGSGGWSTAVFLAVLSMSPWQFYGLVAVCLVTVARPIEEDVLLESLGCMWQIWIFLGRKGVIVVSVLETNLFASTGCMNSPMSLDHVSHIFLEIQGCLFSVFSG